MSFERVGEIVQLRDERFDRAIGGRETDENKCAATFAEEDGIAQIEIGDNAGDAGLVFERVDDGGERLLALVRIGWRKALNDEDDAVDEGGMKTSGKFLRDSFGLAAFDAGGGLEMALGVEGEGKKRESGGEDEGGQPKAAQMQKTHGLI